MKPSISAQFHMVNVKRFGEHHGRALTWVYAWRRVLMLALVIVPLCILVAFAAPMLMIGFALVAMMHAAVMYKTHRNWRDD